jgi:acetyltransferase-like isoleucine patch superfamily enzyme
MNQWLNRWRKLKFSLTPPRWRSPFSRDDPWLAKYEIGEWTYGHPKVLDWGSGAKLQIGRFCSIAGDVKLFVDGEHHTDWVSTFPITGLLTEEDNRTHCVASKGDLIIGNDVWICDGAAILSGVRIGNGAVVGARSLVTKDVPPYAVVAGNPARVVRFRLSAEQISQLEQIAWWDWPVDRVREAIPLLCSAAIDEFIARYLPKDVAGG